MIIRISYFLFNLFFIICSSIFLLILVSSEVEKLQNLSLWNRSLEYQQRIHHPRNKYMF
jgi:hypothetical protein